MTWVTGHSVNEGKEADVSEVQAERATGSKEQTAGR